MDEHINNTTAKRCLHATTLTDCTIAKKMKSEQGCLDDINCLDGEGGINKESCIDKECIDLRKCDYVKHYILPKSLVMNKLNNFFKHLVVYGEHDECKYRRDAHFHVLGETFCSSVYWRQCTEKEMRRWKVAREDVDAFLAGNSFFVRSFKHHQNLIKWIRNHCNVLLDDSFKFILPRSFIDRLNDASEIDKELMDEFKRRYPKYDSWKHWLKSRDATQLVKDRLEVMEEMRQEEDLVKQCVNY